MKNATKHAETLKTLSKRLIKEHKAVPRQQVDPLQALVRGAMSFDVSEAKVDEVMTHIEREFVDLNELRVATDLEIQELLGARYPQIEKRVAMITLALNHIFEREHTMSLNRLKEISRRDARQFLRDLPEMHPFVEAYVTLFAFDGPAVPLDDTMLARLRDEGVVDENITLDDAQKFLEHHLKGEECYEFYFALRASTSFDDAGSKPKKKK
jgi:endonuclease III